MHSAAYVLMHTIRYNYLKGTEFATSQFHTLQLRLLKIGARVEVLKTAVRFFLPASFPCKEVFAHVIAMLQMPRTT